MEPALSKRHPQRTGALRSSLLAASQASMDVSLRQRSGCTSSRALYRACANYAMAVRCVSCACIDLSPNVACRKAPSSEGSPVSSH